VSFVIINPGSGPVPRANVRSAIANMKHWCKEAGPLYTFVRDEKLEDGDGRFGFRVTHMRPEKRRPSKRLVECKHTVLMPGLPIARVRYAREAGQNIWDFPRLYLDGNSWVWCWSFPHKDEEPTHPISEGGSR
jgi:hypothetical protein